MYIDRPGLDGVEEYRVAFHIIRFELEVHRRVDCPLDFGNVTQEGPAIDRVGLNGDMERLLERVPIGVRHGHGDVRLAG